MKKFYSALVINGKDFPNIHQVFKPRYNKEFFKRLSENVKRLAPIAFSKSEIDALKDDSLKIIELKNRLEKAPEDSEAKVQLEAIEHRVMPLVIRIPNRKSKLVPSEDVILDQIETNFTKENLSKVLSHRKLSYINDCYSKSVVGPNSHYYYGIGAKLQYGMNSFFSHELEKKKFVPISGMCLVKSAIVEATNSMASKKWATDPCRILEDDKSKFTAFHLVEASRESLVAFITTIGQRSSNSPLRLMSSGAGYRKGSQWIDSDDKRVTQFETLHSLTLTSSIEQHSMKEYLENRDIIWNIYKQLDLPSRLVHCSQNSMLANEYDAHRIDLWLPSEREWVSVSRVSHYLDYLTVRTGMKRGHMIDSTVYDGHVLAASLIENRQTSQGKFLIPDVLRNHMIHLSRDEQREYFRDATSSDISHSVGPLSNYEQRRYLVKKSYVLGHSEKAYRANTIRNQRSIAICISVFAVFCILVDWDEVCILYVPNSIRRFFYDKIYRVVRRLWWKFVYPEGTVKPDDLPFDQLDKSLENLTMVQRRKLAYSKRSSS